LDSRRSRLIERCFSRDVMAAESHEPRRAETIRKIADLALGDAVEITLLIALLEGQNSGSVNEQLNDVGAA
jgi:hypothetical protein